MKLFFLIPRLDYSGAARQLVLLATGLAREQFSLRVCILGRPAPWVETLRAAGIEVDALSWSRIVDVQPGLRLRRLLRDYQPDIVHAWDLPGLWPASLLRRWAGRSRWILSAFLPARNPRPRRGRLDRLFRPGDYHVVANGPAEAARCRALGFPDDRIVRIPPACPVPQPAAEGGSLRREQGLPAGARLLACVGPIEPHKGFHDAVWALDMLRFLSGNLHLVLVGRGSDEARIRSFARSIDVAGHVHWLGCRAEVLPILRQAEMVWVPSRRAAGLNAALEAMAAGRPVLAAQQPDLAEIVVDGETGLFVPPGDRAALARQTRMLLDDPERRRRLGEAGRQRVESWFTVAEMVRRYGELYRSLLTEEN